MRVVVCVCVKARAKTDKQICKHINCNNNNNYNNDNNNKEMKALCVCIGTQWQHQPAKKLWDYYARMQQKKLKLSISGDFTWNRYVTKQQNI